MHYYYDLTEVRKTAEGTKRKTLYVGLDWGFMYYMKQVLIEECEEDEDCPEDIKYIILTKTVKRQSTWESIRDRYPYVVSKNEIELPWE